MALLNIEDEMKRLIAAILLFAAWPALAADLNGYTAKYECRAGGANCNVNVATLTAQACQQTIAAGDAWATINWSNNVICLANGDHTAKGTLTLGSSGTSGTRKVLRYYRASDTDDEPWDQGANQAKLYGIDTDNQDYWIIHRITIDRNYSGNGTLLSVYGNTTFLIMNRILVQRGAESGWLVAIASTGQEDITLQNSVVRSATLSPAYPIENQCVGVGNTLRYRVVNNEIYDCNKAVTASDGDSFIGGVVENNDLYQSPAGQTNCSGNLDTAPRNCGTMEGMAVFKGGAASGDANIGRVIQNRIWGGRVGDSLIALPGENIAVSLSSSPNGGTGADYMLIQNNIIFDGHVGVWNYHGLNPAFPNVIDGPNNNSVVGNLLYDMANRDAQAVDNGAFNLWRSQTFEFYLNTVIKAADVWMRYSSGSGESNDNHDVRCNVVIDSAVGDFTNFGAGSQVDHTTYYGTTAGTEVNKLGNYALNTRAYNTPYLLNAIIRTGAASACTAANDSDCFLYKVTTAGTSAGANPGYTTTLGGTTTDGTMVVKAIRGPYTFKRKLRTVAGGETVVIPYARFHSSAPDALFCPSTYAGRTGIGIGNE